MAGDTLLKFFFGEMLDKCEKTVRPEFTCHCFTPSTGGKRSIQPLSNSNRSCFGHALSAYLQ